MADSLQDMLGAAGVECMFQRDAQRPTITKLRVISRQQQLIRLDFEESVIEVADDGLDSDLEALLESSGALVLSDYAKGTLQHPQSIITAAIAAGVPVLVDPKGTDFSRYRGATLLTPNFHEFELVVGPCPSEQELVEKGELLMRELELGALLITRSLVIVGRCRLAPQLAWYD